MALAKTAVGYGVPLVVSTGPENDPRGPLYPEVAAVIGDHPVIHRGGSFDAFDFPGFEAAVAATGMRHLVIAGLMTEGCILHTSLGALRRDYTVSLVIDATAGENTAIHDAAVTRLIQLGVVPVSWLSFASELQRTYDNLDTVGIYSGHPDAGARIRQESEHPGGQGRAGPRSVTQNERRAAQNGGSAPALH